MIARVWSAEATPALAPRYVDHLSGVVLPTIRNTAGYEGAMLLQRPTGAAVEIIVVTYWQSLEAVRAFAGADLEQAVVAADAKPLLSRFDQRVRHYEVAVRDGVVGQGSEFL